MLEIIWDKFLAILQDPTQLFRLVLLFAVAIVLVHFLSRSLAFLFRLFLALLLIGIIIWFFF